MTNSVITYDLFVFDGLGTIQYYHLENYPAHGEEGINELENTSFEKQAIIDKYEALGRTPKIGSAN